MDLRKLGKYEAIVSSGLRCFLSTRLKCDRREYTLCTICNFHEILLSININMTMHLVVLTFFVYTLSIGYVLYQRGSLIECRYFKTPG